MTNQPNSPAAFATDVAPDAAPLAGEDQTVARDLETRFSAPDGFATVVDLPIGVFAPLVVTESVESALALASAGVLPGPALESLAALRLPKPQREAGPAEHVQDGPALQPPRRVVFAPDGNSESLQAARQAARRAHAAGWTVDGLLLPEGWTWADVEAGRVSSPEDHLARIGDLWIPYPDADFREELYRCETAADLANADPAQDLEGHLPEVPA